MREAGEQGEEVQVSRRRRRSERNPGAKCESVRLGHLGTGRPGRGRVAIPNFSTQLLQLSPKTQCWLERCKGTDVWLIWSGGGSEHVSTVESRHIPEASWPRQAAAQTHMLQDWHIEHQRQSSKNTHGKGFWPIIE